ncbi:hypothetical protein V6N11_036411 [Hibiscus sabdariffa]|uniref:Uncharacterized protein n=1 Tax=Hibiscus sabdariffa TaxID=183260 RepID=A0ABR2RAC2_9ROSI
MISGLSWYVSLLGLDARKPSRRSSRRQPPLLRSSVRKTVIASTLATVIESTSPDVFLPLFSVQRTRKRGNSPVVSLSRRRRSDGLSGVLRPSSGSRRTPLPLSG